MTGFRRFRFDGFLVDAGTSELFLDGVRLPLQDVPFRLLMALLDTPGELVSREHLRENVWPSELNLDYENSLATAVFKVRQALGDSASAPKYIETHPGKGYRFLRPVEVLPADEPGGAVPAAGPRRRRWAWMVGAGLAGILAGLALGGLRARPVRSIPHFLAVTCQKGNLVSARFTPDGQSIVYSAAWGGHPMNAFLCRRDGTGTRSLDLPGAMIQAVGPKGELLVIRKPEHWNATAGGWGRLALADLEGSTPHELQEGVFAADFGPGGAIAAGILSGDGLRSRLEYPLGHVLLDSGAHRIGPLRVSPDGRFVAVLLQEGAQTVLALLDRAGIRRDLYRGAHSMSPTLCWVQQGRALAFTAGSYISTGSPLMVVDLEGRARVLLADSSLPAVWDASIQGRVLFERCSWYLEALAQRDGLERDLSPAGTTLLTGLTADGQRALLVVSEVQGRSYLLRDGQWLPQGDPEHRDQTCLRATDGSPPVPMGPGTGFCLSPDGAWALCAQEGGSVRIHLVPTGSGSERPLAQGPPDPAGATFSADGRTVWIWGLESPGNTLAQPYDLEGRPGPPLHVPLPNLHALSPGGDRFLGSDRNGGMFLVDIRSGRRQPLAFTLEPQENLVAWDREDELVVAHPLDSAHVRLDRVRLADGVRRPAGTCGPRSPEGIVLLEKVLLSRDRRTVCFNLTRVVHSDLLVAEGLLPEGSRGLD